MTDFQANRVLRILSINKRIQWGPAPENLVDSVRQTVGVSCAHFAASSIMGQQDQQVWLQLLPMLKRTWRRAVQERTFPR